jgi:hypothetical protein
MVIGACAASPKGDIKAPIMGDPETTYIGKSRRESHEKN